MPDMDGIDAAAQIYRNAPVPVILVSAYHDPEFIRRAEADHILAYLVKPIKQADLEPAIGIAMRRFEQFQALRKETSDLKQALEDRKVIEKAKGILMKKAGLDEHDAFRRLQKLASDKNRKLIEIAQMILTAEEALEPPGRTMTATRWSSFPHEICPVDGTVLEGHGVMDESYLTGEPYHDVQDAGLARAVGRHQRRHGPDHPGRPAGGRFALRQDHAGDARLGAAPAAAAPPRRPTGRRLHARGRRHRPGRLGRQRRRRCASWPCWSSPRPVRC